MITWQTSFSAGELSPKLHGRFSLDVYAQGAAKLSNLLVMKEGGLTRHPGTEHMATLAGTGPVQLEPFLRSDERPVLIVFRDGTIRPYDGLSGAPLIDALASPFQTADIGNVYSFQSADVMYLCDRAGLVAPRCLVRSSDVSWGLSAFEFVKGPMRDRNTSDVTLTPAATLGATTLTASAPTFVAGDVGSLLRLFEPLGAQPYQVWQAEQSPDVADGDIRTVEGRVYRANKLASGKNSNAPPVHQEGTAEDGSGRVSWTYLHDFAGFATITAVSSGVSIEIDIEGNLPSDQPTGQWAKSYVSTAAGWPFCGGIYEERLFFGGTLAAPDTLMMSRTAGFDAEGADFNRSRGAGDVEDSHAIIRTLADSEVRKISWAIADEVLILAHKGGLVRVSGPTAQEPITPAGIAAKRAPHPPGAYAKARGIRAGRRIVYVSASGRELIAVDPADFEYQTLTVLAEQVGTAKIKRLCYLSEPDNWLYALAEDGQLWCCTFEESQDVVAWSRVMIPGFIEDMAVAVDEDERDRLWLAVRRTVDDADLATLERLARPFDENLQRLVEAHHLAGAKIIDRWNKDASNSLRLDSPVALLRGDTVTVAAPGAPFGASDVGAIVRIEAEDAAFDAELSIATVTPTLTMTAIEDVPFDLLLKPLARWAVIDDKITGLRHLEKLNVGLWADGESQAARLVQEGEVKADRAFAYAVVGLPMPFEGQTLPVVIQGRDGPSAGQLMQGKKLFVDLLASAAGEGCIDFVLDGKVQNTVDVIAPHDDEDFLSEPLKARSGLRRLNVPSASARTLTVRLTSSKHGPMTVRAMGIEQ